MRTTCPYCGVGCGISATVSADRELTIAGDKAHPANRGKLCSKGTHLGETVSLEGRLLHPMIGERQSGWDEALDLVSDRLRATIAQHGPDSVAFYVSGQLLTEDYYVANKLMKGFIGSGNIDTNSRLCMASAVAAHNRAFGEDVVPCSYDDLDEADLILLVGSNTAWCHPVIWQRIEAARARRGTKLVVIDPRRTETAEQADLHVAVEPDGDIALFNGLLAEMDARGLVDREFLAAHVDVPAGFWEELHALPQPLPPAGGELADLVVTHPKMVTLFSQGVNQSRSGTDKGNAIINLHLALGRIGKPGAGPFSITGQPNAMGGREVGGLANMLACHLSFSPEERADAADFWGAPNVCAGPGLKAVDMFRAVHDERIKFLWVMATNPAVSMPDAGFVREALAKCPFVVVSDVIGDTDTGKFAHVRLPALAWGEKSGTVTNSERLVSRQRALMAPPGEARADWRIMCDVAERMGWGEAFAFSGPGAVFREYAAMTGLAVRRGLKLDLTERATLSDAGYNAMAPFQWGGPSPFASSCFSHADGRARMIAVRVPERIEDAAFPLRLNTGRYRDQWHTMTRTGLSAKLSRHRREPLLEVHPRDAEAAGLSDGGLGQVSSEHGSATFRVSVTDAQAPGGAFVPMHWTDAMAQGSVANRLVSQDIDPTSGQPGFKDTPAAVTPVTTEWRGFLVCRTIPALSGLVYATRARVAGGWLIEMAGDGPVPVDGLLPDGARIEASDLTRGLRRIAVSEADGTLSAALFVTRSGALPERDWIAGQLGQPLSGAEVLAGRAAGPREDKGPLVCICCDVGEKAICTAIAGGAMDLAAIAQCTRAGSNCGSCRPVISRLLAAAKLEPVAA